MNKLMDWLNDTEKTLMDQAGRPIPDNIPIIDQLLHDHQTFKEEIQAHQPEVEKLTKTGKKATGAGVPILRHTRRGSPRKLL